MLSIALSWSIPLYRPYLFSALFHPESDSQTWPFCNFLAHGRVIVLTTILFFHLQLFCRIIIRACKRTNTKVSWHRAQSGALLQRGGDPLHITRFSNVTGSKPSIHATDVAKFLFCACSNQSIHLYTWDSNQLKHSLS